VSPKTYIGSVIWRSVEPLHMKSLVALLQDPSYAYFPQIGDALVERARAISASYFLRHTQADVHLSLDSDIVGFEKNDIDLMCEQALTYDIVGAVYICRSATRTFPATFFKDGEPIELAFDPTPQPVQWVATGCLAVHRRVFEKMAETMPLLHERDGDRAFYNFYQTMEYDSEVGRILLSEDYAFSQRAKDLGFTSYINPSVRIGHVGSYTYRLEDMGQETVEPRPLKLERRGTVWRISEGEAPIRDNRAERRRKASVR